MVASRWPQRLLVGGFHQPLDLRLGQVFASAQVAVVAAARGLTVRFTVAGETSLRCRLAMEISLSRYINCSNNSPFLDSLSMEQKRRRSRLEVFDGFRLGTLGAEL